MRFIALALVGCLAAPIGQFALAADLPSRGNPPTPPAPVSAPFTWTGAYFGLNGGYGVGRATGSYGISSTTLEQLPPIIPTLDAAGSRTLTLRGGLVGIGAGYNWQTGNAFVFGVEGDIRWSGLNGSIVNAGIVPVAGGPYSITQNFKADWMGSVRGRIGFTPVDRLLVFAAGGPAVAHIGYSSAFTDSFNENETVSIRSDRPGWTVGGGLEYALATNWSAKAEYLHSEFSAANATGSATLTDGTIATAAHSTGILKVDEMRVGINYRFD
jgi:outer membrane immunogenic protein